MKIAASTASSLISVLVLVIHINAQAATCSSERMNELRLAASAMSADTIPLSGELALCPDFHDEALLWAAFYYNQNGQYDQSLDMSGMVDKPDSVSDRYHVLANAGKGNYQQLKQLVDSGAAGYQGDAEAHLVLARSLTRGKQGEAAHVQYEKYLQLKPDDLDVRIEEAYSYIWNDDWKKAQKKFALLGMQKLSPTQKKTVQAGMEQVEKIRLRQMAEGHENGTAVPLGYERVWNSFKSFSRQSLLAGYHTGGYHFDAAVITLNSDDYTTQQSAGEVLLSKNFTFSNGADIYAKAGWLQGVGGNYTAAAVLSKTLKSGFRPLVGFESVPLVKTAPIPKEHTDWSQRSAFVGFRYKDRFEYRIYALNATDQGSAAKHSLLLEMPIKIAPDSGQLQFKILAESLAAQTYSPYIYSPHDSTLVLPGLIWNVKVDDTSDIKTTFDYGFVSEKLNEGAPGGTVSLANNSSGQLFGFGLKYRTEIDQSLDAELSFQYDRTSSGGGVSYQAGQIYVGLVWYPEKEEKSGERP